MFLLSVEKEEILGRLDKEEDSSGESYFTAKSMFFLPPPSGDQTLAALNKDFSRGIPNIIH